MRCFAFKPNFFFAVFALCCFATAARADDADRQEITAITVLADRALTVPLTQLASDYTRAHHISVSVAFSPSFEQALAIESGETVDLFISAHPKTLEQLKQQGVFDVYSITPLVATRLVLVTSSAYKKETENLSINTFLTLRKMDNFLLAVANSSAAAEGFYAGQVLNYLRRHIFLTDAIVEMQNTSDIVDFLSATEGFGLVFESDALQSTVLRKVAKIPDEWYQKPVFTAAVVAGGAMEEARKFLTFLQTRSSQRVFIKNGLYPTPKTPSIPQS